MIIELDQETNYRWQKGSGYEEVLYAANALLKQNLCYREAPIIGFPGTPPHIIGVETYKSALDGHSNCIGMHTDEESEKGFVGAQRAECEVIAMTADLLGSSPEEVDDYLSPGGTEANLCGIWIGRDRLAKNAPTAVLCSFLTHYSVTKAVNVLGIGTHPRQNGTGIHLLGTDQGGHLLLDQLQSKLDEVLKAGVKNIIVVANAGTTMMGSVDNIPVIGDMIESYRERYPQASFHVHIDAAFGGFIIPFIKDLPDIGFRNKGVDSITIDAHKMGQAPYGSGIFLTRKGLFKVIRTEAPYVPGHDCTLCGSRPGAMAISCWAVMQRIGKEGYAKEAKRALDLTNETKSRLADLGLDSFSNDINIIAVKDPELSVISKLEERGSWISHCHKQFPSNMINPTQNIPDSSNAIWNIVVMPHVDENRIDRLLNDIKNVMK